MKSHLKFTYDDEILFRGYYLYDSGHPWLFVVMEDPRYPLLDFLDSKIKNG